jgi:nitroimidazol reductase NimA-like FMN-containing flavoprotein (pyridoxamine 5'-phosphate oxidase superfamily)
MSSKDTIYAYLQENKYMALATANKQGKPEVATVEYVLDGDALLVNTFVHYRKYENITNNPQVACVITTGHDMTLQFEGTIRELEGSEASTARQKMLTAEPDFADYFNDEHTRFFTITPTWMRLRDYTKDPMQVLELGA